jgi:hypothetical protein
MNGVLIAALATLSMVQQTDTTFGASDARKLELKTPAGRIVVNGWDRSDVRVHAEHSSRTYVEIRRSRDGSLIRAEAEARRGPATIVDYEVWMPRALALEIDADMSDVTIEGVDGDVEVDVTRGDVSLRGGSGSVNVSSVTGKILVEATGGRIDAETAADEIRLVDVAGEVVAESAGGDIILEGSRASSVDVGSVGGRIYYDGDFQPGGTYFFGSHGGSVTIVVPEGTAATFSVSTVHGSIVSRLGEQPDELERGTRHRFDIGGGGPLVEAETFGGRISLVRPGATESRVPERRPRGRDEDPFPAALAGLPSLVEAVPGIVVAAVAHALAGLEIEVDTDVTATIRR